MYLSQADLKLLSQLTEVRLDAGATRSQPNTLEFEEEVTLQSASPLSQLLSSIEVNKREKKQ